MFTLSKRHHGENFKYHSYFKYLEYCTTFVKVKGLWMEFGVHKGSSITYLSGLTTETIYGFDSWEGLPEDWVKDDTDIYKKGVFSLQGQPPQIKKDNIKLIKGWFNETLPTFLEEHVESCAFIHIDSDLYSSCKTILTLLTPRIVSGTVILFDEFYNYPMYKNDEYKAFLEFIEETGHRYDWIAHTQSDYEWNGQQAALIIL